MNPPSFRWLIFTILAIFSSFSLVAQTNPPPKWQKEMAEFATSDRTNPPPKHAIIFVGSSTIRFWKTLPEDFPGKTVVNRGFGGSQISDVIEHFDQVVTPCEPRIIVFYSGDNDLAASKSPERVFADFKTFLKKVHARSPETTVVDISIKPCPARWKLKDQVDTVNASIQSLRDPRLRFINIAPLMLGEDGQPKKDLFKADGLHPSQKCYEMWAKVITPCLDELLSQPNSLRTPPSNKTFLHGL